MPLKHEVKLRRTRVILRKALRFLLSNFYLSLMIDYFDLRQAF